MKVFFLLSLQQVLNFNENVWRPCLQIRLLFLTDIELENQERTGKKKLGSRFILLGNISTIWTKKASHPCAAVALVGGYVCTLCQ
jgi:hypothetical protein